nr:glycoside hydrolase family 5 protein [Neobacillus sp. Marseille-Q6967]
MKDLRILLGSIIAITLLVIGFIIGVKKDSKTSETNSTIIEENEIEKYNLFKTTLPNNMGVNIHFTGNPLDIDMISDAGFKIVRMDLFWNSVEKARGKYDFKSSGYDLLTNALVEEGIRPYYILNYSNSIYEEKRSIVTKKGQDAFVKYAGKAADRYKNKGIIWEIWNEPNLPRYWETRPNFDEYSSLVKRVSKEIKEKDPSGIVVAPALSGMNTDSLKWLEEIIKRGILDYIDAISVHPYRGSNPETVANDYQSLRVLINKYSKKEIPIISGEWGYSTAKGWFGESLSEHQQAEYLVRMFMVNTLYDIPISIWYDWKNDGTEPNNGEHNFGIRQNNVKIPKDAYLAMNNLTNILSGHTLIKRVDVGDPNDYVLEYVNGEGITVIVFWTTGNSQRITLPDKNYKGKLISMYGKNIGEMNNKNSEIIEITSSPKYLIVE